MNGLRVFIHNLAIVLILSLGTVIVVGSFNPMMGFTEGVPFLVLTVITVFVTLLSAILALNPRKKRKHSHER